MLACSQWQILHDLWSCSSLSSCSPLARVGSDWFEPVLAAETGGLSLPLGDALLGLQSTKASTRLSKDEKPTSNRSYCLKSKFKYFFQLFCFWYILHNLQRNFDGF